jgi:hypothetical protein
VEDLQSRNITVPSDGEDEKKKIYRDTIVMLTYRKGKENGKNVETI